MFYYNKSDSGMILNKDAQIPGRIKQKDNPWWSITAQRSCFDIYIYIHIHFCPVNEIVERGQKPETGP